MHLRIACVLLCLMVAGLSAADPSVCSIVPRPVKVEAKDGVFKLGPDSLILTDAATQATGQYLSQKLSAATGYKMPVTEASSQSPKGNIVLSVAANAGGGPEGYELTITPESVGIRGADEAGVFYGVQSLLQLLPPQALGAKFSTAADWQVPCMKVEDRPRFKWRGMMLDISRHFFNKDQVERVIDLMALHKLNTLHWHLVDHDGWRVQINKYPKLTEVGAWRGAIGYGLDPRTSAAYGPDGRYGGYFTQDELREVVAYAAARHINVVPEIEMPGHSGAALASYPEYNCDNAEGTGLARNVGVYCAGKDETFTFLENVLDEVLAIFPSKYVHIGGDEVSKDNWTKCPKCQARMKAENLKNEHELQSYFIRRVEKFINQRGRTLVGWSEIREGGLAENAVMMDWIGGGLESAREGHDVVMTPGDYCYFDHGQSLDYTLQPVAICCYRSLRHIYSFEPIPAGLDTQYHKHILGGQANLWTEFIASPRHLDYMVFPRLCAMAEVLWSSKDSRNWDDFSRRMQTHRQRLDVLDVYYYEDNYAKIGEWTPDQLAAGEATLEWDVSERMAGAGKYRVIFDWSRGNSLKIAWVALLEDGREIARDTHPGCAAADCRDPISRDVVYMLGVPGYKEGARFTIKAQVAGDGGGDSGGVVELGPPTRPTIR